MFAIRKYGTDKKEINEDPGKKVRVSLFLETEDFKNLRAMSHWEGIKSSGDLRHLLSKYLRVNESVLNQMIVFPIHSR
jgi:hypothetical protein